jgi:hypothetical protein
MHNWTNNIGTCILAAEISKCGPVYPSQAVQNKLRLSEVNGAKPDLLRFQRGAARPFTNHPALGF